MRLKTLYIAGHTGLVGSALVRCWANAPRVQLLTAPRAELDLTDPHAVETWLTRERPDEIVIAAGLVGGIAANASRPASFIYENLMIEANLIHGAWKAGVRRLLNFGSSCMYPRHSPQPMRPELLMTGPMEPTSAPYALAKWAGMSLCASYNRQYGTRFITAIPATVYGPGDHFDAEEAHVLPALMRRFHEAKVERQREVTLEGDAAPRAGQSGVVRGVRSLPHPEDSAEGEAASASERRKGKPGGFPSEVTLWGTGAPRREFVYADDLAEACELLLERYEGDAPINIGSGQTPTVRELAALIADVVGFTGEIRWDSSQPDGAPEKSLDSSVIRALGWRPRTSLREGIGRTYRWFLEVFPCAVC